MATFLLRAFLCALLFCAASTASAVTYTFLSDPFTEDQPGGCVPNCGDQIRARIEVPTALRFYGPTRTLTYFADYLGEQGNSPLRFSLEFIDNSPGCAGRCVDDLTGYFDNPRVYAGIEITVTSSWELLSASMALINDFQDIGISMTGVTMMISGPDGRDYISTSGTWRLSEVPLPPGLLLGFSGLLGLGALRYRRTKSALA